MRDPDLNRLLDGLAKATGLKGERLGNALGELVAPVLGKLSDRIKALETMHRAGPQLRYLGVWRHSLDCRRGDMVTHQGQLWHCRCETTQPPGTEDWQLMQKRAR